MITLLVRPDEIDGDEVSVVGDAYQHLARARRVETGEEVRVVDGGGRARLGVVAGIDRKVARIALGAPAPARDPAFQVTLLVPTLRPERASWLVEKATEVGVAGVHFLQMERAPRTFGDGTLDRLRRVAAAALEQSGGATLPTIDGPHDWNALERLAEGTGARFVLDPAGAGRFEPAAGASTVALLVGPEGGLTAGELADARRLRFAPIALGPRILRIETAALAGAVLALLGRG